MSYWKSNVRALERAFVRAMQMHPADMPDIVCLEDVGIVDDQPMTSDEIADALDILLEYHLDDDSAFGEYLCSIHYADDMGAAGIL